MSKLQMILALVLLDFAAFTGWAVYNEGLLPAFGFVGEHLWTIQLAVDLVLAIGFAMAWMWRDARRRGVNPMPWMILTALTGSIGWLAYLVVRPADQEVFAPAADSRRGGAILAS